MSIFQCEVCGCMENTALGLYWGRQEVKKCSACAPDTWPDGSKAKNFGKWHNQFKRRFFEKGMYVTNREGNLAHKVTGMEVDLRHGFDVEQELDDVDT